MGDKKKRIVITGLGVLSPLGIGIKQYWNSLLRKSFPLSNIDLFSTTEFKCKKAFQVKNFDFSKFYPHLRSEYMPRSTKMLLSSVKMALKDSGLSDKGPYGNRDWGVFTSTIYGSWKATYYFYKNVLLNGPQYVDPMAFPPALINYSSSYLCIVNGFQGPNLTFSGGYNAGLEAINYASEMIKYGLIKVGMVNGLNDLGADSYAHLSLKGLLYVPNKKEGYKPGIFDARRKGFIVGENSSSVVLEDIENAIRRKAKIYAEVVGYGVNFGNTSEDYEKVMLTAINNSNLKPADIDACLINASGRRLADALEIKAIEKLFKSSLEQIDFLALKENNGECEGASAVVETLTAAKALRSRVFPPSLLEYKNSNVLGKIGLIRKRHNTKIKNILINSFNIEGNNSSLIIRGLG